MLLFGDAEEVLLRHPAAIKAAVAKGLRDASTLNAARITIAEMFGVYCPVGIAAAQP